MLDVSPFRRGSHVARHEAHPRLPRCLKPGQHGVYHFKWRLGVDAPLHIEATLVDARAMDEKIKLSDSGVIGKRGKLVLGANVQCVKLHVAPNLMRERIHRCPSRVPHGGMYDRST